MARRNLSIILTLSMICNFLFLNHLLRRDESSDVSSARVNFFQELVNRRIQVIDNEAKDVAKERRLFLKHQNQQQQLIRLSSLVDEYFKQKLVFIVGAMSSGTTLMRLILDVHPDVNCGDETKIVHLLLEFVDSVYRDRFYVQFMNNSGVKNETINKAAALFVYYMMENNKKHPDVDMSKIKYLCNKEPMNTYQMGFLHSMFPNSRFVYVVRDGRDVAYSLLRRNKQESTFDRFYEILSYWNSKNKLGLHHCNEMGAAHCHLVKYEGLVTQPESTIRGITQFLGLAWTDDLLHHDRFLNGKNISLSNEPIFADIQKNEINNQSIGKWRNKIPDYNEKVVNDNIVMLKEFNYFS